MRRTSRAVLVSLSVALSAGAADAQSLPPLSQHEYINGALLSAAIGDRIRKNCNSISPRLLKVWREAQALKAYAREQGYSDAQIEAFIDSKPDRERLKAQAKSYLAERGAVDGREETYCAIGEREIAANTLAGSLLRAH